MVKLVLYALFALCLVLDIDCLTLDRCPPGYRCRKKTSQPRLRRSPDSAVQDEFELELCPPGTFNPGGSTECTPCPIGTYAPHSGAPGCYLCPSGYMCPHTDQEAELCPRGSYNNRTGQTCCRSCPAGQYTRLEGMQQCSACPAGRPCPAKQKLTCENEEK